MSPAWVSNPRPPAQQTEALPTDWTIVFCARSRPKREQKYTTKNFVEFRNHSPQLTTPQTLSLPDRHAYSMFLVVSVVKITYLPQWLPLFQYCRKRTDRIHDYFWLSHWVVVSITEFKVTCTFLAGRQTFLGYLVFNIADKELIVALVSLPVFIFISFNLL